MKVLSILLFISSWTSEKAGYLLEPNLDCSVNKTGVIYNVMSVQLKKIQKKMYG